MMSSVLKALAVCLVFCYGVFTIAVYVVIAVFNGTFFRGPTEKERLELLLAKDRLWNLSKQWSGLDHRFLTVSDGFKFHYVTNATPGSHATHGSLVIFLHGFPDSWAIWRHILASPLIRERSTVVAVDLPGYGGSDGLEVYGASEVLEKLTEFIVGIREQYGVDISENNKPARKVIIVGHDWGALLGFRLASEAPQLANRFILTNGPLFALMRTNIALAVSSSAKMFKTFWRNPLHSHSILFQSIIALRRVLRQLAMSGYIFAFQLPVPMVRYLGAGGNHSFLKFVHKQAAGAVGEYTIRDAEESMASTIGPGDEECQTVTSDGEQYPPSVAKRQKAGNFIDTVSYYRDGAATRRWHKSLRTITALHGLSPGEPRRTSSGTGFFDPSAGTLKANATILWGALDSALDSHLALEGIADYLVRGSQVITLPKTGHFSPMEVEGRGALEKAVEWAIGDEKRDVRDVIAEVYPEATVAVRK